MRHAHLLAFAAAGALLVPATASAQAKKASTKAATPSLKWGPAPAVFRPGAKLAVVSGDPMSAGQYDIQLSMPANYKIAPHYHPTDEHLKIVRGEFKIGMGDKWDAK